MMVLFTAVNKTTNSWKYAVCCTLHSWSFLVSVMHKQHSSATQMSCTLEVGVSGNVALTLAKRIFLNQKSDSNLFYVFYLQTMVTPVGLSELDSSFPQGDGWSHPRVRMWLTTPFQNLRRRIDNSDMILNNIHFTKCKRIVLPSVKILCLF